MLIPTKQVRFGWWLKNLCTCYKYKGFFSIKIKNERKKIYEKIIYIRSVTEGHPDKLCDYISDSILDACLEQDKNSRVACETVAGKGEIYITGEITSNANINIEQIVRDTIKEVGYDNEKTDIDYKTCKVIINMSKQSQDMHLVWTSH